MYETCASSSQTNTTWERRDHKVPLLTQELFTTDNFREGKNPFSSIECPWVPQSLFRTGLILSSWPIKIRLCFFKGKKGNEVG